MLMSATKHFLVMSKLCNCRKQSKSIRHEVKGVIVTCELHAGGEAASSGDSRLPGA